MQMRSVIADLRRRVKNSGQTAVAADLGVSNSYLCHILAGRRKPGPRLLRAMGYRQTIDRLSTS